MLKKSSRPTSNISWPDVVFFAEANQEPFADAQIITLYAHCLNIAEEKNVQPIIIPDLGRELHPFKDLKTFWQGYAEAEWVS